VPVFGAEFREHGVQARCRRLHVDDIGGDVTAAGFELVDLGLVGGQDLRGCGAPAGTGTSGSVRSFDAAPAGNVRNSATGDGAIFG
jgi:hypothetical protein